MSNAQGQFTLDRHIATSPETLWHILTDAKQREIWGAPSDEHVLTLVTSDVVEGGFDQHRCGPKNNPDFVVDTRWYRLDAPHTAAFTERLHAGEGSWSVSLVGYELTPATGGTDLKIDVSVLSFEGPEMVGEHEGGWTSALGRMEAMIADGRLPA